MAGFLSLGLTLAACSGSSSNGSLTFDPGASDDPVMKMAQALSPPAACNTATHQGLVDLFEDDFAGPAWDKLWPASAGYEGDFHAEWITDGVTARAINPTWPEADPAAPQLPFITGFVKFLDLCPVPGARVSVHAHAVTTSYTDPTSDATLIVYFFDDRSNLLGYQLSTTVFQGIDGPLNILNEPVPAQTRRIAVVPMARLGENETETIHYRNLSVEYATDDNLTYFATQDTFDNLDKSKYGNNQPDDFIDYGTDWFGEIAHGWLTAINPAMSGGTADLETGTYKEYKFRPKAGAVLNAGIFMSTTFTDPTSFALLRVRFEDGSIVDSTRFALSNYGRLSLSRVPVPPKDDRVELQVVAYLGPNEASSLYVDDLEMSVERTRFRLLAAKAYAPDVAYPGEQIFEAAQSVFIPKEIPIDATTDPNAAAPWSLDPGNAANQWVELVFQNGTQPAVTCRYQGKGKSAHTAPKDLKNALVYELDGNCDDKAKSEGGDALLATRVTLNVLAGDTNQPSTRVAISLEHEPAP